jgi:ribosomal protein L24E
MPKKKGSIFDKPKDEEELIGEPNEFLESEEHPETPDNFTIKLQVGDKETDIYTEEGREELEENEGEIAPWEEGFAAGAEGTEGGHCAHCHKPLGDREEGVIEKKRKGEETLFFCSEKCASAGAIKKKE